ncbi:VOC family protein [Nocardia harenae]|uniref:VOC family protein n=1 Tax=Nocardia harenae TaxID=358707 RepID=UPI0008315F1B|nr:VOC family protein [Nocardia harenae]
MIQLLGINHLTLATPELDRLVAFYTGALGARETFARAATGSAPRIAVLDVGGARVVGAGRPTGRIETLPTQWTMTAYDPDGRAVDIRAHR